WSSDVCSSDLVIWPMNPNARLDVSSVKALLAKGADALTDDELAELVALRDDIDALLKASAGDGQADSPEGLAPEDPRRRALEARARLPQPRSRAVLI